MIKGLQGPDHEVGTFESGLRVTGEAGELLDP
jgi:hypothetical protein